MFIPNQDDGGSDKSDRNCNNDAAFGCWTPQLAIVDKEWTLHNFLITLSDIVPWDYAYLVVSDVGSHVGKPDNNANLALDNTVPALDVSFAKPNLGDPTMAFGYPEIQDPAFRYCTQRN